MSRKLNDPFRWQAPPMTKVEVSAIKVLDTDSCIRMELYTPAPNGERLVKGIDVPFMPTAMHADCISLKNHNRIVAREVDAAVKTANETADARMTAAEEKARDTEAGLRDRIVRLEEMLALSETHSLDAAKEATATIANFDARLAAATAENERAKMQSAALNDLMGVIEQVDKLSLLFLHRPAFGQSLRVLLKTFKAGDFNRYVTLTAHETALTMAREDSDKAVYAATHEVVRRLRDAFVICTKRLAEINIAHPEIDVMAALEAVEHALIPFDGV